MLFCDVTGSTALGEQLDPESMRHVMSRYFDEIQRSIGRHGGTVEKFIGDAVMAAFGIPVLHEDDAVRAVRAAAEIRAALETLNDSLAADWGVRIQSRTGIYTGEVVAGDTASGSTFATGDTVNTAARLEQNAQPGEILIGESTYRLVRDAVRVEPVEPLTLKGKGELVPAYRLLAVDTEAPGLTRRLTSRIVGREEELRTLLDLFSTAEAERACRLAVVYGPAGAGKSRLTMEFVAAVGERATVVNGRCMPYGEGITYFPVAVAVKGITGIDDGESRASAREKLRRVLPPGEDGDLVAARLAGAIGLDDLVGRPEEIAWAVRRLFESLAVDRPLVVFFDDIHWAEAIFLNLLEYLASFSRGVPIVVVCTSRPELRERLPGTLANATALALPPLGRQHCEQLVEALLDAGVPSVVRSRVVDAAEGNPLFVEELVRMLVDDGVLVRRDGQWQAVGDLSRAVIPPSVEALLAARLDRLDAPERTVLQRASVIGRVFGWDAVSALSSPEERDHVGPSLQALVRRDFIAPDAGALAGEDAFRFSHILARDAAYRGIPKEMKARLHEAFADFLEERAGLRAAEYEEIIGYHLEQAYAQRAELGPVGGRGEMLRERASRRLASAGDRASLRGDLPAAANLLERAAALAASGGAERSEILGRLAGSLLRLGQLEEAEALFTQARDEAAAAGDELRGLRAEIGREFALLRLAPDGRVDAIGSLTRRAIPVFEAAGDEFGLTRAWRLRSEVARLNVRFGDEADALEHALRHAERAGDEREVAEIRIDLGGGMCYGPTPVSVAAARCREVLEAARGVRWVEASVLAQLAFLEAMRGAADTAREQWRRSRAILEELGMTFVVVARAAIPAAIETMARDFPAAEEYLRKSCEALEAIGERDVRSTNTALLAHVLYEQGADDDALACAVTSEQLAAADDVLSQCLWRAARAKVLARRDGDVVAEALAEDAVTLAASTDYLSVHGNTLLDLAEVLSHLERADEAAVPIANALALFEAKEDAASTVRAVRLRNSLAVAG